METPKISIIIPVLNNLFGLQKTIESIQNQLFKNYEVWIIDGDSSNETLEYLSKLETPFFYQSEKDKGIYDAMNKGISLAKGEWFYFLGSGDCLNNETVLKEVSNALNPKIQLLYGNVRYENSFFNSKFTSLLWIKNSLHHQAVFYHRNLFENREYDINFKILGDYDLNLKLFRSKINSKKEDFTIAFCDDQGISKKYNWSLYKEELNLKTQQTFFILYPIFFLLVFVKFGSKRFFL